MESFVLGKLEIAPKKIGETVIFNWIGVSENKELIPYLEPYHNKILASSPPKKATLDFRALKSMNSSTVPAIIDWVKNYGENGVEVKVYYNKTSNWQRASFRLLGTIAMSLKNVSVEALEA
ncbi:MAG: hypothetical protein AAF518_23755 [Spirochaetota bacterium]